MNKATLPQPVGSNWFCLDCANSLSEIPCEDPFAVCLACKFDHRFFVMPKGTPFTMEQDKQRERELRSLKIPALVDESVEFIASFWLSQSQYREYLNPGLAEMLRAILDKVRHKRRVLKRIELNWCPGCGSKLSEFQVDGWLRGLKCVHEHNFHFRGDRLSIGREPLFNLEFDDFVLKDGIKKWAKPNLSWLIPGPKGIYIHPSIRQLFKDFQKSVNF
jgi:hypothetical protein